MVQPMILPLISPSDEGAIVVAILFSLLGIGFLWLHFIAEPQERRAQKKREKQWEEEQERRRREYEKEYKILQSSKSTLLHSKSLFEQNLNKTFYLPLKEQTELLIEQIKQNID